MEQKTKTMNKYIKLARKSRRASTKDFHQWKSCENKTAFATRKEAEAGQSDQRAYRCKYCDKFHRTKKTEYGVIHTIYKINKDKYL